MSQNRPLYFLNTRYMNRLVNDIPRNLTPESYKLSRLTYKL